MALGLALAVAALVRPALWLAPAAAAAAYLAMHARFYAYLWRADGPALALAGIPLLLGSHAACLLGVPTGGWRVAVRLARELGSRSLRSDV